MRYAMLLGLAVAAAACSSKDSAKPAPDTGATHGDAGTSHPDAGASSTTSTLERAVLPRAPAVDHLPDALRPPR